MIRRAVTLCLLVACAGCTSAQQASNMAWSHNYKITLYSGGKEIKAWHTKGMPHNEEHSDGYFFVDRDNGKLMSITGDVVIEQED